MTSHTVVPNRTMVSGQAIAEQREYNELRMKDGIWLWSTNENAGDYVYFEQNGGSNEGFGGGIINFPLKEGRTYRAKGPWHTNPDALFQATGIDLRQKHLTWGIISKSREGEVYKDILHLDEEPVVGSFDRIELRAEELAKELNIRLYFHVQSTGGSHTGFTEC